MDTVQGLNQNERMFLAGCMKNLILVDGSIETNEIEGLDDVIDALRFTDFDERLGRFEEQTRTWERFWEEASQIESKESREFILAVLEEMAVKDALYERAERKLIDDLRAHWQMPAE